MSRHAPKSIVHLAVLASACVLSGSLFAQNTNNTGNFCTGSPSCTGIPSDDLVIADSTPLLRFDDTTSGATDFDVYTSGLTSLVFGSGLFVPFIIDSGARSNALRIGANGNIGLGTSVPGATLDMLAPTPTLRMEDSGSGFSWLMSADAASFRFSHPSAAAPPLAIANSAAPRIGIGTTGPLGTLHLLEDAPSLVFGDSVQSQRWKVTADADAFLVEKMPQGTIPLVLKQGATPADVLAGIGTGNPAAQLHVLDDETAEVRVENISGTEAPRTLFTLVNAGNTKFEIRDRNTSSSWAFTGNVNDFRISRQGSGVIEFRVDNNGDAFLAGVLSENSDRNAKTGITPVDPAEVLDKVLGLPVAHWAYKETPDARHIGPMAQDFRAAFGTGSSDTALATLDVGGVALASIQALAARNRALQQEMAALKDEVTRLRTAEDVRVERLEHQLTELRRVLERSLASNAAP